MDWISVEKKLPPRNTPIIVYDAHMKKVYGTEIYIFVTLDENGSKISEIKDWNSSVKCNITHWKPVGEPPKGTT